MLKKILVFTLAFTLILSGCASGEAAEINWESDLYEHWTLDENGEKARIAEHNFVEDSVCTVCKSEVFDYGDGNGEVYEYIDEGKNLVSSLKVYENGEVVQNITAEYEFDENENLTYYTVSLNGKVVEEYFCTESVSVFYEEDGSYFKKFTGEDGTIVNTYYYADGTVYSERSHAFKDNGETYMLQSVDYDFENGIKYVIEYNIYGNVTRHEMYDLEDNLLSTIIYEFDEEGLPTYQANYEGDMLTIELYYKNLIDSDGNPFTIVVKEVIYKEDGGYFLCEFDDYGIVINEGEFDADGNKIR